MAIARAASLTLRTSDDTIALLISYEIRPMLRHRALRDAEERNREAALSIEALPLLDRKRRKDQIMDDD